MPAPAKRFVPFKSAGLDLPIDMSDFSCRPDRYPFGRTRGTLRRQCAKNSAIARSFALRIGPFQGAALCRLGRSRGRCPGPHWQARLGVVWMLRQFNGVSVKRVIDRSGTRVPEHAHDWPVLSIFVIGGYLNKTELGGILFARPPAVFDRAGPAHAKTVPSARVAPI